MILKFFQDLIIFIITLGILITIHECGHFLVAKFLKVKIERFSIGFGPVLWNWKSSNGTEYVVSLILFGGYVKLLDTKIKEIINSVKHNNLFRYKRIWERALIVVAGPIFNFILAILLYTIIFIVGIPSCSSIVTYVMPDSIAFQAKILSGSKIKLIDNVSIDNWNVIRSNILNKTNREKIIVSTELIDNNNIVSEMHDVYLNTDWINKLMPNSFQDFLVAIGILPNFIRINSIILEKEHYIFHKQDCLKINDQILLINGKPIYNWEFFEQTIMNNVQKTFQIIIDRNGEILNLDVELYKDKPFSLKEIKKRINYFSKTVVIPRNSEISQYTVYVSILKACDKTANLICSIINTLFQLIIGNVKITNLHGPIAIAKWAERSVHLGIIYYLMFLATMSINLGVINLLPIPILDGGQLFFLLIEKITGNSIPEKIQNFICTLSFVVLMLITLIALYNDIII